MFFNRIMNPLTTIEQTELTKCEEVIDRTKGAFLECGIALASIRDKKLYRRDFRTFDAYCQDRWGWQRMHAHRLIEAAKVVEDLPQNVSRGIQNERQARALAKVPKEQRVEVIKAVTESGPITSERITETARKFKDPLDHLQQPVEYHPDDDDSDNLFHLKNKWRKTSNRDREAFLAWIQTDQAQRRRRSAKVAR